MNQRSLEDVIRQVHEKYKHKPSPLQFLDPEKPMAVVPQKTTPKTDSRSTLLQDFKPQKYTF